MNSIKNIELSSLCNMACDYCLSPTIKQYRKPGLMTFETFKKVVDQIKIFQEAGTQRQIWLHGTGESFLNKDIVRMVEYLNFIVDDLSFVAISTNGKLINEDIIRALKKAGLTRLDVSNHNPAIAEQASKIIEKVGISSTLAIGVNKSKFNWAGQLDFEMNHRHHHPCPWIKNQECFVQHDGTIVSCCYDAYGIKKLGSIDDINNIKIEPYELCNKCEHSFTF